MVVLTYIVRTVMALAFMPMCYLVYAMYQDFKTLGKDN
jgi:hypothetical protein